MSRGPRYLGRAIWAAYADTNALSVPCPNCEAPQGVWCTKPDGRVSKMPCIARITLADITPHEVAANTTLTSEREPHSRSTAIDFSEPRREHP